MNQETKQKLVIMLGGVIVITLLFFLFAILILPRLASAQTLRLPTTIEINYCGDKQTRDYLEFRTDIISMTDQGGIDPCLFKGYIKMLNIEHNLKRLKLNYKQNAKDFFKDLNLQIKTRTL